MAIFMSMNNNNNNNTVQIIIVHWKENYFQKYQSLAYIIVLWTTSMLVF